MTRYLLYKETQFHETLPDVVNKNDLAVLELNNESYVGTLFLNQNIGTIDRLTAHRIANSICKTGFLFEDNQRIGTRFTLQIAKDFDEFFVSNKPKMIQDQSKVYESITDYFWVELFGKVYGSWEDLPDNAKKDLFSVINVEYLSHEQVQELFKLRHYNNKEAFIEKIAEYQS